MPEATILDLFDSDSEIRKVLPTPFDFKFPFHTRKPNFNRQSAYLKRKPSNDDIILTGKYSGNVLSFEFSDEPALFIVDVDAKVELRDIGTKGVDVVDFKRKEMIMNILSFKALNNNWDGYSAYPSEIESATNTLSFINHLSGESLQHIEELFPNPNGTISLIWKIQGVEVASVEIGNDTMSYYVLDAQKEPLFFDHIEISLSEIKTLEGYIKLS